MKATYVHSLSFPDRPNVTIYRADHPVECWKCGSNARRIGYPWGNKQEPNCEKCIRKLQTEAYEDAADGRERTVLRVPSLIVAVALIFGVFAAVALATFPASPKLDYAASLIAGKAVHVKCYDSNAEWNTRVSYVYAGTHTGDQVTAFTFDGTALEEVSPRICRTAFYAMRVGASKVNLYKLGAMIDVLSHEPNHAYGIHSESQAEACARRYFALTAHVVLGLRYHTSLMRSVTQSALAYSRTLDPAYQNGVCPR